MNELIDRLSADLAPAKPRAATRRIAPALAGGMLASLVLLWLTFGPRADIAAALVSPDFWIKLGFNLGLAALAVPMVCRLAVPGRSAGRWRYLGAAWALAIVVAGAMQLLLADSSARAGLWLGHSWLQCPFDVALFSLPIFTCVLWAVRRLAPTHLAYAGLAVGLLSGAAGASVYSLACPESSIAFLATWYLAGIALVGTLGWLLGPRLLRW